MTKEEKKNWDELTDAMSEKAKLAQKLLNTQRDIGIIGKDATIRFGNTNYKAVTCDKVLERILPIAQKHGLLLTWTELLSELELLSWIESYNGKETTKRAYKAITKVMLEIIDIETGYSRQFSASGMGLDSGDKAPGKAATYAMKYALKLALGLQFGENDEARGELGIPASDGAARAAALSKKTTKTANKKPVTDEERNLASLEEYSW